MDNGMFTSLDDNSVHCVIWCITGELSSRDKRGMNKSLEEKKGSLMNRSTNSLKKNIDIYKIYSSIETMFPKVLVSIPLPESMNIFFFGHGSGHDLVLERK